MSQKVFVDQRKKGINYDKLSSLHETDTVLVYADTFFELYPTIVKLYDLNSSEKRKIKDIYYKIVSSYNKTILNPNDTIRLTVSDALVYFKNVQKFLNNDSFYEVAKTRNKRFYTFDWEEL